MRFATVALAVFGAAASASASLVARQSPYPTCAEPCIASADYGTCQQTDIKCLCTSNAFVAGTTACIQSKCTGDDLTKAQTVATGLCSSVGVTLTPAASSAAGSATGSASGSAPVSTSTSPSGSSKPASGSGSSTGSPSPSPSTGAASTNGVAMIGVAAAAMAAFAL